MHLRRLALILTSLFVYFALTGLPAQAQEAVKDTPQVTVDRDNISELIKTLESDTARTDFINNLKTLSETTADPNATTEETPAAALSQAMGINASTDHFLARYNDFLQSYDLNTTVIGRAVLTLLSILVLGCVWVLINKAITRLHNRLQRLRDKYNLTHNRFRLYTRLIRFSASVAMLCLLTYTNAVIWGVDNIGFVRNDFAIQLLKNVLNITIVSIFALGMWEAINLYIEGMLLKKDSMNTNRMRTVIPIIRNIAVVIFGSLFGLVLLSELGIDIMPLLAGAGVIGIAIGFGAQTMVKNYIAGLTIIMEDLMQVGDVVHLAGRRGVIEQITIRKVQLRGVDGNVHTIPFSEITVIENMTKDFSYYVMDVGVSYREDTDKIIGYLREIAHELRDDEAFKGLIDEELEVMGVDRLNETGVIIKARLKTVPGQQWRVGREFNRRMKYKFDIHDVELPLSALYSQQQAQIKP
ncbi:MAG: mechanosensitive ion channel domain-containing protein [Pseudomonadota bacterium]